MLSSKSLGVVPPQSLLAVMCLINESETYTLTLKNLDVTVRLEWAGPEQNTVWAITSHTLQTGKLLTHFSVKVSNLSVF